jgi:uncharacterized protein (DUF885 family)
MIDPDQYFEWQDPQNLLKLSQQHGGELESCLGNRAREFREGFIAARFAVQLRADRVRLLRTEDTAPTPDFAVRLANKELWYEITEVDRPERKRGN